MNGNPNASPVRDETMLNIRYIARGQKTRLWQYIGLPERMYNKGERRWTLTAPSMQRFAGWWRYMRSTGRIPAGKDLDAEFEMAQLLLGGYYNQDPNTGRIEGTTVCYAKVVEELPLPKDAIEYQLPDEVPDSSSAINS